MTFSPLLARCPEAGAGFIPLPTHQPTRPTEAYALLSYQTPCYRAARCWPSCIITWAPGRQFRQCHAQLSCTIPCSCYHQGLLNWCVYGVDFGNFLDSNSSFDLIYSWQTLLPDPGLCGPVVSFKPDEPKEPK